MGKRSSNVGKMRGPIPLCRSEFLQDVTIELGRRSLKGLRYHSVLEFDLTEEEVDGTPVERLNIETRNLHQVTNISIWANGVAWVNCREQQIKKVSSKCVFRTHADFAGMAREQIADLLRGTLNDLDSVRKIWEQRAIME